MSRPSSSTTPTARSATTTFVKVYTDEGLTGLGEAGINGKELALKGLVETYTPLLVGMDPSRIEHIWQMLWRGQFFRGGHVHAAAVAAIDLALWDLRGKALGVPVYDLLGGKTRDYARCYCHVQRRASARAARRTRARRHRLDGRVREGARGGGLAVRPLRRRRGRRRGAGRHLRAVQGDALDGRCLRRPARSPGAGDRDCVDFHQRTTPTYAIQMARALEPLRPFFIEDPLRAENPAELRYLRQHISAPIATGEQLASKWDWQALIEGDLMDYCRVDLCICGGLTEARKIAGWCETHYIEQAPHNPLGPVRRRPACISTSPRRSSPCRS